MEGYQRVGGISELPAVLRRFDVEPAAVLRSIGLPENAIDDPESALSFPEVGRLFEASVAATGCPHLGHLVGERSGLDHLGLVGRLMRHAPTVGDALRDLCSNQHRYIRGGVVYLAVQDGSALLGYAIHYPGIDALVQFSEGCIAAGFNIVRALARRGVDEVLSARAAVADPLAYRRFFGVSPRFDAEQHAIVFPATMLDWKVVGADPEQRRLLEAQVAHYWAVQQPTLAERATRHLRAQIVIGSATRENLARVLAVSERSLNRRLQEEGTSFRALLDRSRFQVAQQLLLGTRMSVTSVALALGYGETSAFDHAFRRWSGRSPSEWRETVTEPTADRDGRGACPAA